ncbi:MAG TPA: ribonucleoside hydrolase RihC [Firmicutes bacterium]|nr:ribonucleoside hydrolase RihC [Bacillota bacterium]
MSRIPVIIDTDPGVDDAAALAAACFCDQLDIRLITTVSGNVSCEKTTANALKLLEFFKKDIPVARGCAFPLLRSPFYADDVHGETGLDGYIFPPPSSSPVPVHAVEAIHHVLLESSEPMTLITLGALTNIAALLTLYPEIKPRVREIITMGGSFSGGNVTSGAEFNIYADPHAAQIVLQSGVPILLVGLDVTMKALLEPEDVEQIQSTGPTGQMLCALFAHYRASCRDGLEMHDSCAVAALVKPELFTIQNVFAEVILDGPGAGTVIGDFRMRFHDHPNARACMAVNTPAFRQWLVQALRKADAAE